MSVMKIAGKTSNNTVQGVAVSPDGNVQTQKVWRNEVTQIYSDNSTPGKGSHDCTDLDLADVGAVSLRVRNTSDVSIDLTLYVDYMSNAYRLKDASGEDMQFTVDANTTNVVITPDDWPILQWLAKLRLKFITNSSATTGTVAIYAVTKR